MDVDLDRYAGPPTDPAVLAARREALVDQLGWLQDEAQALAPVLAGLPEWALVQTPLADERSLKATLANLVRLDREVYPRWVERVIAEDAPELEPEGAGADDGAAPSLEALLAELHDARAALVRTFEAVPAGEWARTGRLGGGPLSLYDLALRVVRHDADALRTLAYRLHESNLGDREG